MKLLITILAASLMVSTSSFAAKGEKKAGKRAEIRKALKAYDLNRNRQIDGTEIEAVKSAYSAFKRIDANADGTIGDDEIKTLNSKATGAKERKTKGDGTDGVKKKRKKAR